MPAVHNANTSHITRCECLKVCMVLRRGNNLNSTRVNSKFVVVIFLNICIDKWNGSLHTRLSLIKSKFKARVASLIALCKKIHLRVFG